MGTITQALVQNTEASIALLLSQSLLYENNFLSVIRLLLGNEVNASLAYGISCKTWTIEVFDRVLEWTLQAHPMYRSALLPPSCLRNVPMMPYALERMMHKKLGMLIPRNLGVGSLHVRRTMSRIDGMLCLPDWCIRPPNKKLHPWQLKKVDLASHISILCLVSHYPDKQTILGVLHEQLDTTVPRSLSVLLLNLRHVPTRELIGLRQAVKKIICSKNDQDLFHILNAKVLQCTWLDTFGVDFSQFSKLSDLPHTDLVLALRLLLVSFNSSVVMDIVGTLNIDNMILNNDVYDLLRDLVNLSLGDRRIFATRLGLDYDSLTLAKPPEVWAEGSAQMCNMPLDWRINLLLRWHSTPSKRSVECFTGRVSELRPLVHIPGDDVTVEALHQYLTLIVSNNEKFVTVSEGLIRPRCWLPAVEFRHVIDVILYSQLRFRRSFTKLSPYYCHALLNNSISGFIEDDLFYSLDKSSNDLEDNMGRLRDAVEMASQDWKMHLIMGPDEYCNFVSTDV